MTRSEGAAEAQVRAADPQQSTWLSANAGSGKTRVLTDRVARMLLAGVDPGRILCLTYTRAAASEMQNRLFQRLGDWAMKGDAALAAALDDLGLDAAVDADRLASARRLFARAIEVPGGLRIQTIHSFCASLLRRFPLEAGVSPQFTEMDDRAAKLLRAQIVDELASDRAPEVIADLARAYTGEGFADLAEEVAARRGAFGAFLGQAECLALFDLPEGLTAASLAGSVMGPGDKALLSQVAEVLQAGGKSDLTAAGKLRRLAPGEPDLKDLAILEGILLTGSSAKVPFSAKTGSFPTKAMQAALGPMQNLLEAMMLRVEAARRQRIGLAAAARAEVLHRFAAAFLPLYAERKARRGMLDFDDLIVRARALLTDPSVAQWILFRLDGGIDHILVDEAQDTSPDQWAVIERLTDEFTSGSGALSQTRTDARTIFVVGDKKQSIYSFQGADVAAFDAKRALFSTRLQGVGMRLQVRELAHSFRSSPAILRLVDQTFDAVGDRGLGGEVRHIAFRDQMPGRIDLWPPVEASADPEPENWFDPVDLIGDAHHATRLGRRVAEAIREMIAHGRQIPEKSTGAMRPVRAGDILILVQRRSEIFASVIAACKALGLPVAGADRLRLGGELAVRDITALLSFLDTPEDDLSLAAVLKSPFFNWTEAQLYAVAQPRTGTLWEALRKSTSAPETQAILTDLRDRADFLRPYDLIERILTRHQGRSRLIARLGDEANDGIDELLAQALTYERGEVPGLTGFLDWLNAGEVEIKRQTDAAGDRIRVMTVHGAKGLEAPVVILPDTALRRPREPGELVLLPDAPVWKTPTDESPDAIAAAIDSRKARNAAESLRLLYVAMTRAQSWLIVAAAGDIGKEMPEGGPQAVWYRLIRDAMEAIGARGVPDGGLTYEEGIWPEPSPQDAATVEPATALPEWITQPAPDRPRPAQPVSPSQLGGAKALPDDSAPFDPDVHPEDGSATDRGSRLHLLLEHLPDHPETDWPALVAALLPRATDADALFAEARRLLGNQALRFLFAPGTLAEVAVTAPWGERRLLGSIDRLVVAPDHVLAVDFKSNAVVPERASDVPDGILRQMGAYDLALCQIYPHRRIETAIVWTCVPRLMLLDPDIVRTALTRATIP